MSNRSLKTSAVGQAKAKQAIYRKGWTQDYLAAQVGLSTRQSVWKFVSGRPIDRNIFIELCFQLDLDWEKMADLPQETELTPPLSELDPNSAPDDLLHSAKAKLRGQIQAQCGILESPFDMTQRLRLEQVYTQVNILPRLSHQQWLEISDLQDNDSPGDRFRFNQAHQTPIPAMDAIANYSKLMILGKPGAGKTTFLKYLALQCQEGHFNPDCLVLFFSLRAFATYQKETRDFKFSNYLQVTFTRAEISPEQGQTLLQQGKVLLLLDALDEIAQQDIAEVISSIQQFIETYPQNQIIITCRIAAQSYHFGGFAYVELADFNQAQVESFAQRWFTAIPRKAKKEGSQKAAQFLEQLNQKENQPIRELTCTPILLRLICSVFQERVAFPHKRSKLYQEGLEILLSRWDQARGITRDQIYGNLSLPEKLKLLSAIAAFTWERGHYFFETNEVLPIIADYLLTLPQTDPDPETLWLNSEAVLKAIEVQHGLIVERAKGIYSFSHLTFQEYLTARKIVASPNPEALVQSLSQLATHVTEAQWREVISLTVTMLPNADFLCQQLKAQVDQLLAVDSRLQQVLHSLAQKANSLQVSYKTSAVRAFYFGLSHFRDLNLAFSLDPELAQDLSADLALDLALTRAFAISLSLVEQPELERILNLGFALDLERRFQLDGELDQALRSLKQQLPNLAEGKKSLLAWWPVNGEEWIQCFRTLMIEQRNLGQDWRLSQDQQQLLQQYYEANQFLVDCLNSHCQLTPSIRAAIESTLLLAQGHRQPIGHIRKSFDPKLIPGSLPRGIGDQ